MAVHEHNIVEILESSLSLAPYWNVQRGLAQPRDEFQVRAQVPALIAHLNFR